MIGLTEGQSWRQQSLEVEKKKKLTTVPKKADEDTKVNGLTDVTVPKKAEAEEAHKLKKDSMSEPIQKDGEKLWFDEVTEYNEEDYLRMLCVFDEPPATINMKLPHVRSDLASTIMYYSDAGYLLMLTLQEARDTCEIKRRTVKSQEATDTMSAVMRRINFY